jgi:hypothetical protein
VQPGQGYLDNPNIDRFLREPAREYAGYGLGEST